MSEELQRWVETVNDWGGRLSSPEKKKVLSQLGEAQLGVTRKLATTGLSSLLPESVLLAQVQLSVAIPMEIAFSYTNMRSPLGVFPPVNLDQGNGFVRLTWGTPGTFQHTADIDGNRGWRKQFVASFMRVEYIPIDPEVSPRVIPSGQARELGIQAMISPAINETQQRLTKTEFMPDLAGAGVANVQIPRWATDVQIVGSWPAAPAAFTVLLQEESSAAVSTFGSDLTVNMPFLQAISTRFPVPQRAQRCFLVMAPASAVNRPKAVFGLSL